MGQGKTHGRRLLRSGGRLVSAEQVAVDCHLGFERAQIHGRPERAPMLEEDSPPAPRESDGLASGEAVGGRDEVVERGPVLDGCDQGSDPESEGTDGRWGRHATATLS